MKIKLDENLPEGLVVALTGLGHDVDTVVHEGLAFDLTKRLDNQWAVTKNA